MSAQRERITLTRTAPTLSQRASRFTKVSFRLMRSNPNLAIGVSILLVISVIAIFAPLIATSDYTRVAPLERLKPPSAEHWFGTDDVGRDVFDRTMVGSRISLLVGFAVTGISVAVGLVIALFAGYFRRLDNIVMRFVDGLLAFPTILLALALIALLGASINNVIIALSVTGTAAKVRLVRGQVLSLREQQFVDGARAIGAPVWRILFLHIAPNTISVVMVQATFTLASTILAEASLSFLGAGVPNYIPTWGNIVASGSGRIQVAFWVSFFPGLFLTLTVLSVVLIGDALRDYLDPRLRGQFKFQ
ncbi:MAG: ABC transporter permease [Chloroflexi bacterium]|nr:ABC transporter permease [Chloroflexota bacterium]